MLAFRSIRAVVAAGLGLVLGLCAGGAWAETKPAVVWRPAYSGNYTRHAGSRPITAIVLHVTEGSGMGAASWFADPASGVSAHYIVQFTGTIQQCVADKDIAWHAGNSYYNTASIGIEHAGHTYKNEWTDAQYKTSARLVRWLCETYGIPKDREHIVGHAEIPGSTHTDPGPYFNWDYYLALVRGGSAAAPTSTLAARRVVSATLNMRSGPSTSRSILGTVAKGQVYVTAAKSGDWREVYYRGRRGWLHAGYTSAVTAGTVAQIEPGVLAVRSGPSTSYGRSGDVYAGQMHFVIETRSDWHRIWWGGAARWVYGGSTRERTLAAE